MVGYIVIEFRYEFYRIYILIECIFALKISCAKWVLQCHFGEVEMNSGSTVSNIIKKINKIALNKEYPVLAKGEIALACLEAERDIINGCTDDIVIAGLIANLQRVGEKY
jgi:hypothetical protein